MNQANLERIGNLWNAHQTGIPIRIDTKEAATVTGFTEQKLYLLRKNGGGPRYVKHGGQVRYLLSDVLEWLESYNSEGGVCRSKSNQAALNHTPHIFETPHP